MFYLLIKVDDQVYGAVQEENYSFHFLKTNMNNLKSKVAIFHIVITVKLLESTKYAGEK